MSTDTHYVYLSFKFNISSKLLQHIPINLLQKNYKHQLYYHVKN